MQRNILDEQSTSNALIRKEKKHNLFVFKIQPNIAKIARIVVIILIVLILLASAIYLGVVS